MVALSKLAVELVADSELLLVDTRRVYSVKVAPASPPIAITVNKMK